jgi:hypothetical protein
MILCGVSTNTNYFITVETMVGLLPENTKTKWNTHSLNSRYDKKITLSFIKKKKYLGKY